MRLLMVIELLLVLASAAPGADYTVRDKTTPAAYTVRDNTAGCPGGVCGASCACPTGACPGKCPIAAAPAGYSPAPAGFHWAQYPGGVWGLVQDGATLKATKAPAVAAPRPFYRPPTPPTTAPPAGGSRTSWPGSTPTGHTPTGAPTAALPGGTNCAPGEA